MDDFHEKIAEISLGHFESLPKTGKPAATQWTVLSSIVMESDDGFQVVASGTGTKCIGSKAMSPNGDVLNDSHAEVICRRSFMRFLYEHLETPQYFILDTQQKVFCLNKSIKFHFFTTQVPCGDAAIFPSEEPPPKKRKLELNHHKTGAKFLSDTRSCDVFRLQDVPGAVRTKPGKGDATLSVSCSDKLAKWCHVGVQGALLSLLMDKPLVFDSFTIAARTEFNLEAFERAVYKRLDKTAKMRIGQSKRHSFNFQQDQQRTQPCPSSISWTKTVHDDERQLEVSVDGKRQGVTKKNRHKAVGRLRISKLELFRCFSAVYSRIHSDDVVAGLSYKQVKGLAEDYQWNWECVRSTYFKVWPRKSDDLLEFSCSV